MFKIRTWRTNQIIFKIHFIYFVVLFFSVIKHLFWIILFKENIIIKRSIKFNREKFINDVDIFTFVLQFTLYKNCIIIKY